MKLLLAIPVGLYRILQGMAVTFVNLLRPKTTIQYPWQQREVAPGYRGLFAQKLDPETGELNCTACEACARACPSIVFTIEGEGKGKERKPSRFDMDLSRCLFCHLCVEACPFDAIKMTSEYVKVGTTRADSLVDLPALIEAWRRVGSGEAKQP
jgi:NADH-quinone oxidoreductase subunit I